MYIFRDEKNKHGIYIFSPTNGVIKNLIVVAKESEDQYSYYTLETNVDFFADIEETSRRLFAIIDDPQNVNEGASVTGTIFEVLSELEEYVPNIADIVHTWEEHFYTLVPWERLDDTKYIKELRSLWGCPVAVVYDTLISEFLVYEEFINCFSSVERFKMLQEHSLIVSSKLHPLFRILYVNESKNEEGCYYRTTKHGKTEFKIREFVEPNIFSQYSYKHLIDEFVKFN